MKQQNAFVEKLFVLNKRNKFNYSNAIKLIKRKNLSGH